MCSDKNRVRQRILEYLKKRQIEFAFLRETQDQQDELEVVEGEETTDTLHIFLPAEEVIGGYLEAEFFFQDQFFRFRIFYRQFVSADEEKYPRICRFLNYINTKALSEDSENLYRSVMALDEDYCDIYIGTLIRYELLERFFDFSMFYLIDYLSAIMRGCCYPLVAYSRHNIEYEEAVDMVIKKFG